MRLNAQKTCDESAAPAEAAGGFAHDALDAFRDSRLDELARLRDIGIAGAERISRCMQGKATPAEAALLASKDGLFVEFMRTSRAVRQVIVLEMELMGLRPAPDRDAPRGLHAPDAGANDNRGRPGDVLAFGDIGNDYDYNHGPLDEVVARIRKDLRVAAPAEDPFAPKARRAPEPRLSDAPEADLADVGVSETPPRHQALRPASGSPPSFWGRSCGRRWPGSVRQPRRRAPSRGGWRGGRPAESARDADRLGELAGNPKQGFICRDPK